MKACGTKDGSGMGHRASADFTQTLFVLQVRKIRLVRLRKRSTSPPNGSGPLIYGSPAPVGSSLGSALECLSHARACVLAR